jgi:hypothetical protein
VVAKVRDRLAVSISGKKGKHLKDKINELATNNKNKNTRDLNRGINEYKRRYQPKSNLSKDENGDLLGGSKIF